MDGALCCLLYLGEGYPDLPSPARENGPLHPYQRSRIMKQEIPPGFLHSWAALLLACGTLMQSAAADIIDDIKPGQWFEVPNSKLSTVKPNPLPVGNTGLSSVMEAWSGGSFDTKRDRLVVWGGGHGDYSGNEIYAFDLRSMQWQRLTEPSSNVGGDEKSGVYPDGTPRARHTYNYVQYAANLDRFCTFGGAAMYPTGATGTTKTYCFDFEAKKWAYASDALAWGIGAVSAQDPETGHIFIQGGGNSPFAEWDPVRNLWTRYSDYFSGWFEYYQTAAAGQGKFIAVGRGKVIQWDLRNPKAPAKEIATFGDTSFLSGQNPGFVYDTKRNLFVAWNGGANLYAFDPNTRIWSKTAPSPSNSVIPTAVVPAGTYGRFQYVPSRDIYIAVNRTNENVFLFRPPTGMGPGTVGAKPGRPLNEKVEINILGRSLRPRPVGSIPVGAGFTAGGVLTCRIFSTRSELIYEQPISSAVDGPIFIDAPNWPLASGSYFLELRQQGRLLLSARLGSIR